MDRLSGLTGLLLLSVLQLSLAQPPNRTSGWPCLPEQERVPKNQLRNITFPSGTSFPVGITYQRLAAPCQVVSLARIIVEEKLGYGVELEVVESLRGAFFTLVGCDCGGTNSCAQATCPNTQDADPRLHFTAGIFQSPYSAVETEMEQTHREFVPQVVATQGYSAFYGPFLPELPRLQAAEEAGTFLEYYKGYWMSNTSQYFDSIDSVQSLRHCNLTNTQRQSTLSSLVRFYGHEASGVVTLADGTLHIPCYKGVWWLSPSCRDDPSTCIPMLSSGGGSGFSEVAPKAITYNWPIAFGARTQYRKFLSSQARRLLFYGLYPDVSFRIQNGTRIIWPPHDSFEWSQGNQKTSSVDQDVLTLANNKVATSTEGRYLTRFMANVKFSKGQMDAWAEDIGTASSSIELWESSMRTSCDWIYDNREVWEAWIPKSTVCDLGSGLIADVANRLSFVTDESLATDCAYCSSGRYSSPIHLSDGAPSHVCLECPVGREQATSAEAQCTACPVGKHKPQEGTELCQECEAGKHQEATGQSECTLCPPGRSNSGTGQPACVECRLAEFAPEPGREDCTICNEGTFASSLGSVNCTLCSSVIPGSTSERASKSVAECVCPAGTFLKGSEGCVPCLEGLLCERGRSEPLQLGGFWTDLSSEGARRILASEEVRRTQTQDYVVYRCRAVEECPPGPLGSCASGREGIACNNCKDFHFPSESGVCLPCDGASVAPAVSCLLGLPLVVMCLIFFMQLEVNKQQLTTVTAITVFGQVVYAVQLLAAMDQIQVELPEPLASVLKWLGPLILDLDIIRLPCLLGADRPLIKFVVLLVVLPAVALLLLCSWMASRMLKRPINADHLFNLNGNIAYVAYISLSIAIMLPFQCRNNPGPPAFASMKSDPGLKCFEHDEHITLVGLAVFGTLLYPVSLAVWITFVTLKFKTWVHSPHGIRIITVRYRFLFGRFTASGYYFGLLFMFRNLLLASIPVFLVELPTIQVLGMTTVLITGTACQAHFWPWRTEAANRVDMLLNFLLLLLIAGIGTLVKGAEERVEDMLATALTVVIVVSITAALTTAVFYLFRRCKPWKPYDIFLCHHKAGAGSLCRLIKIMVESSSSAAVFLDSDHLDNLDLLFETVRTEVNHFVVVLSQSVLYRHWCAGEISTAYNNHVHTLPLLCDGFQCPGPQEVQKIMDNWTPDEAATLLAFGITTIDITEGYTSLLNLPMLNMPLFEGLYQKEKALKEVIQQVQAFPIYNQVMRENSTQKPVILVAGAVFDAEALAACEIMQLLLQERLEVEVAVVHDEVEAQAFSGSATVFIVLFSRGLLMDPTFGRIVYTLFSRPEGSPHILTAVADTGFQFPDSEFLREVEESGLSVEGAGPPEGLLLATTYFSMLSVLARPFTPLASKGAIAEQVAELSGRARPLLAGKADRVKTNRSSTWTARKSSRSSSNSSIRTRTYSRASSAPRSLPGPSKIAELEWI